MRYQDVRIDLDNQGVGGFNLPSRAYNQRQTEDTGQITETAVIGPRMITETRFQFLRTGAQSAERQHITRHRR